MLKEMAGWSLSSLQLTPIKIGVRVVSHAYGITSQLAEVGLIVFAILAAIRRLRVSPRCA